MLWGAVVVFCQAPVRIVVLAEVAWDGLPEWVRVPYVKTWWCVLDCVPE